MKRNKQLIAAALTLGSMTIAGQAWAATYTDIVLADNPNFYWNMDDITTGTNDSVTNLGSEGNAARNRLYTESNAVAFNAGTSNDGGLSLGNTADFAGIEGRLVSNNNNLTGGTFNQYVIEFWMKTSETDAQYLMRHSTNVIQNFTGNALEVIASGNRTGGDGPVVNDGEWHHIVLGVDSTAGHTIYVDGALHSNQTEIPGAWVGNNIMYLGGSKAGNFYDGQIDELAVYKTDSQNIAALTAQVATHYDAVPEPGSLALLGLGGLLIARRRRDA